MAKNLTPQERNNLAKQLTLNLYNRVKEMSDTDFRSNLLYVEANNILNNLVSEQVKPLGFRGLVLTAIIGREINPKYNFLNDFYSIKPRSLFENGIYYALAELRIPSGKSDPLNVAKNTSVLDTNWASGKHYAATAAVNYLQLLERNYASKSNYNFLVSFFMFKLKELAREIDSFEITQAATNALLPQNIAINLNNFMFGAIEGGTTPQFLIGVLLESLYFYDSNIQVEGTRDSVSGTNTTSKKPGDIVVYRDTKAIQIFEVTMKIIDDKRLADSLSVIREQNMFGVPITFICQTSEDLSKLEDVNYGRIRKNATITQPYPFNFVDIETFISSILSLLDHNQIGYLMKNMQDYISNYLRPKNTKRVWNDVFGE